MAYIYCVSRIFIMKCGMFYFFGLFILFLSSSVFAAIPSGTVYYTALTDGHSSPDSACAASVAALSADESTTNYPRSTYSVSSASQGNCIYIDHYLAYEGADVKDYTRSLSIRKRTNSCPSNSMPSGDVCICDAGFVESGNQCIPEKEDDPCELLATHCAGIEGTSQFWNKSGRAGGDWTCRSATAVMGQEMFPGCTRGCMGENYGSDTSIQNDAGEWFSQGQAKMTGATCDPGAVDDLNAVDPDYEKEETPKKSEAPDSSCPNGFKGEVNGVSVCVPPKASSGVTEKEVKDNGDGTKTNTKTEVKCEKGKCEVTKTSTTVNSTTNTTVGGSSSTTTVDKKAFCAANKTADVCKNEHGESEGGGKFGGNCSAGFTCEGDALQCVIAKEQHKRNCEVNDNLLKTDEYRAWQSAKSWNGKSVTGDLPGNREHTITLSSGDDFIGSGSCPSDKNIELPFGLSFTLTFSAMCPWLRLMGDGFVIVAWIVGALIIIRRQS